MDFLFLKFKTTIIVGYLKNQIITQHWFIGCNCKLGHMLDFISLRLLNLHTFCVLLVARLWLCSMYMCNPKFKGGAVLLICKHSLCNLFFKMLPLKPPPNFEY